MYLQYEILGGQHKLWTERKKAIYSTPLPHTTKEPRTFLGMTGWCRLWILNYGILVKPLYQMIKGNPKTPTWTKEGKRAFQTLKEELLRAPALGLPDVSKPFLLFSHERQGMALGVLAQNLGPYRRAVAYFSEQLDEVSKGWPSCLRAVSAVVINVQEARKFTLGQKMAVFVSISYSSRCTGTEREPLVVSPSRFLKYQAILVEQDDVEILNTDLSNPGAFLSSDQEDSETLHHDCLEVIESTYSSRADLKEEPLPDAESCYTDGSSFVKNGECKSGYAITTLDSVIEAVTSWDFSSKSRNYRTHQSIAEGLRKTNQHMDRF